MSEPTLLIDAPGFYLLNCGGVIEIDQVGCMGGEFVRMKAEGEPLRIAAKADVVALSEAFLRNLRLVGGPQAESMEGLVAGLLSRLSTEGSDAQ